MEAKKNTKAKRILHTVLIFLMVVVVSYAFLSLCNWSFNLKEWTGFSRFILGAEGVVFLIAVLSDL
jgi:hypothetical protein